MDELTSSGIQALKAGERERARQVLAAALLRDRANLTAWLWLSGAVETDAERQACLEQVLRIDPLHPAAVRGLALLAQRRQAVETTRRSPAAARPPQPIPGSSEATLRVYPAARPAVPPPRFYPPGREPERLIFRARPSAAPAFFGALIYLLFLVAAVTALRGMPAMIFLVLLPAGLIGLAVTLYDFMTRANEQYLATNRRVVVQAGLLARRRRSIAVRELAAVTCRRSPAGFLFHTGDLLLVDRQGQRLRLRDLNGCTRCRQELQEAAKRPPTSTY